jgi:DNA-binding PadR family transcriptional regulator
VISFWEQGQRDERGPRRRFYQLTQDGLTAGRALLLERRGAVRQRAAQPARRAARPSPAAEIVAMFRWLG